MPVTTYRQTLPHHPGIALLLLLLTTVAWGDVSLQERYHALKSGAGPILPGTTISISSTEQGERLSAEVSGLLHTPYATVATTLAELQNWCQFMPLHFNIKACTYRTQEGEQRLTLYSGRKYYQSPEDSYTMTYRFETLQHDAMQLSLRLSAEHGPLGTSDYLIEVDALRVEEGTMIHIHSAYRPSFFSSLLSSGYLATLGRDKVGFSRVELGGESHPVQGLRGVLERNVMRYHFAIQAFLDSQSLPEKERHQAVLASWFRQNNSYPQQLHEMSESEYQEIKRKEWDNQQRLQQQLDAVVQITQ